mgnify:CR=1 FL=1
MQPRVRIRTLLDSNKKLPIVEEKEMIVNEQKKPWTKIVSDYTENQPNE